eukprot:CAMPEP_0172938350 /NCGR_PEP_ID=MMETSP1075-20121228/222982_1 /TAXON_ID=2916 /ORGANISM="Ceratium fusus, Strain PA161109" /LENGTH=55 /DNA_ID=CAMNT_0013799731 /DNA_START=347 /DNA_END=514 /DNA_ORIENTATION=-
MTSGQLNATAERGMRSVDTKKDNAAEPYLITSIVKMLKQALKKRYPSTAVQANSQ